MKKGFGFLLALLFCFLGMQNGKADVIWEPEDAFFSEHTDECTYVGRFYMANGPDSIVLVYKNPESAAITARWENGTQAYVTYTYTDPKGVLWGYAGDMGWVPMDYMDLNYDSISFGEAYAAEISEQSGTPAIQKKDEQVFLWEYPGSESFEMVYLDDFDGNLPEYSKVFTDEQNRLWGYVAYYYGYRDKWICIEEPAAAFSELYPDGAPERRPSQGQNASKTQTKRISPAPNYRVTVWLCVAIGLLVLATAACLIRWKKKR